MRNECDGSRYLRAKKILIVEDELTALKVLRYFLDDAGYEVAAATDGLEALELLSRSRFDLVLSDLRMPRMDGVALARQILSTTPVIPIFLMTAYECDEVQALLNFGVPCFNKPLSLDDLLSKIEKVVGNSVAA